MSNSNTWKPGQSGNPKGRPIDPGWKEALAIIKEAAPALETLDLQMLVVYPGFFIDLQRGPPLAM